MEMKVDKKLIRSEREKRAWSQEHLATLAGLGVRTIHRIEKTGSASIESTKALASVFELEISELQIGDESAAEIPRELTWLKLLWALLRAPIRFIATGESYKTRYWRWLTTAACLIGAAGSYILGFSVGISVFIIAGVFFEMALWFKLTEVSRSTNSR